MYNLNVCFLNPGPSVEMRAPGKANYRLEFTCRYFTSTARPRPDSVSSLPPRPSCREVFPAPGWKLCSCCRMSSVLSFSFSFFFFPPKVSPLLRVSSPTSGGEIKLCSSCSSHFELVKPETPSQFVAIINLYLFKQLLLLFYLFVPVLTN